MAAIHLFLGDELSAPNLNLLKTNFDKRTVDLEYELGNTDLNGKFIDTSAYSGGDLWKTLSTSLGLKTPPKPKKVSGGSIDRPATYPVEVEVKGFVFKGKIVFTRKSGDKTTPKIKPNSHPAKVNLKSAGANAGKLPKELKSDLDDLVKEMKKPANYSHTGNTSAADKGWGAKFGKHFVHLDPGSGARKTYVDSITNGTGSVWRMYFDVDFNYTTQALTVSLTDLKQEHKSGGRA